MASKVRKVGKLKKGVERVIHRTPLKTNIPAGQAVAAPPLGPQLGQRGIQIGPFCKDFNEKTKHIKEGVPIPTTISVNPDRSWNIQLSPPPVTYFLMQAAGVPKGAARPGHEVAGKVTLKHIYEIAQVKAADPSLEGVPLQQVCKMVVGIAHKLGIEVVSALDAAEYGSFLEQRREELKQFRKQLDDAKAAKMMRL